MANKLVVKLIVLFFLIYFSLSILDVVCNISFIELGNINLISEITKNKIIAVGTKDKKSSDTANIFITKKENKFFTTYKKPFLINDFKQDSTTPSLKSFSRKLYELKHKSKKRKIRIAYFGDSLIEGDLFTQTLRDLMQKYFGGSGVGFVPIHSVSSNFRQTAQSKISSNWNEFNFKDKCSDLYISGQRFHSDNGSFYCKNNVINDTSVYIEKALICGRTDEPTTVNYNNREINIHTKNKTNRIVLSNDKSNYADIIIKNPNLPVYGVSFESEYGVIIDNFSFRGITGIEYSKIDSSMLESIVQENNYDLIVFQYGVNLLYRPYDIKYNWYAKIMNPIIKKFKTVFSESDILIVSTADRAFRYNGNYESAIGIDSLVKLQAKIAYETDVCFYNQFESMGGKNSMVNWAKNSLANKDYIHPNHKGAALLAGFFFEAILNDVKKIRKEN